MRDVEKPGVKGAKNRQCYRLLMRAITKREKGRNNIPRQVREFYLEKMYGKKCYYVII